jgi:hypothetical protein
MVSGFRFQVSGCRPTRRNLLLSRTRLPIIAKQYISFSGEMREDFNIDKLAGIHYNARWLQASKRDIIEF